MELTQKQFNDLVIAVASAPGYTSYDALEPGKIPLIRALRAIVGYGLKEAKDIVDYADKTDLILRNSMEDNYYLSIHAERAYKGHVTFLPSTEVTSEKEQMLSDIAAYEMRIKELQGDLTYANEQIIGKNITIETLKSVIKKTLDL